MVDEKNEQIKSEEKIKNEEQCFKKNNNLTLDGWSVEERTKEVLQTHLVMTKIIAVGYSPTSAVVLTAGGFRGATSRTREDKDGAVGRHEIVEEHRQRKRKNGARISEDELLKVSDAITRLSRSPGSLDAPAISGFISLCHTSMIGVCHGGVTRYNIYYSMHERTYCMLALIVDTLCQTAITDNCGQKC